MRSSGLLWEGIRPKHDIILGRMSTGSGGLIENSELLAAGCKLEAVAPSDPVIPVADGLVGLIRLDRWRSIAREGLPSCGVANGSAQACRARTDPPRPSVGPRRLPPFGAARLNSRRDTSPGMGADLTFQVVVPAHGLLFRTGVDDRFVVDAIFPRWISLRSSHDFTLRMRRTGARFALPLIQAQLPKAHAKI